MIRELLFELYNGWRQLTYDGSVVVLFVAAILLFYTAFPRKGKKALLLSVLGAVATAMTEAFCQVTAVGNRAVRYIAAAFAAVLTALVIASSGKSVFSAEFTAKAENDMHIPAGLKEAMDAVLSDSDMPKILVMPGWEPYFECYSSKFDLIAADTDEGGAFDKDTGVLFAELEKIDPDMNKVASIAHRRKVRYVVLSNGIWPKIPITKLGYETFYETPSCTVYREVAGQ